MATTPPNTTGDSSSGSTLVFRQSFQRILSVSNRLAFLLHSGPGYDYSLITKFSTSTRGCGRLGLSVLEKSLRVECADKTLFESFSLLLQGLRCVWILPRMADTTALELRQVRQSTMPHLPSIRPSLRVAASARILPMSTSVALHAPPCNSDQRRTGCRPLVVNTAHGSHANAPFDPGMCLDFAGAEDCPWFFVGNRKTRLWWSRDAWGEDRSKARLSSDFTETRHAFAMGD